MHDPRNGQLRAVLAKLVAAAMKDLSATDGALPDRVGRIGWLGAFPEMSAVRAQVARDLVIGTRVDTVVGVEFSMQYQRLDSLIVQRLLEAMVVATGRYEFDQATFDRLYGELEAGLYQDTVRLVEFVPLSGFTSSHEAIPLPGGHVLRPMSDHQVSLAIRALAVPAEIDGPNGVRVSRFNQWAAGAEQLLANDHAITAPPSPMVNKRRVRPIPRVPTVRFAAVRLWPGRRRRIAVDSGSRVAFRRQLRQDFPIVPVAGYFHPPGAFFRRTSAILTSLEVYIRAELAASSKAPLSNPASARQELLLGSREFGHKRRAWACCSEHSPRTAGAIQPFADDRYRCLFVDRAVDWRATCLRCHVAGERCPARSKGDVPSCIIVPWSPIISTRLNASYGRLFHVANWST
jgi:hypothetical protein